MSTAYYIFHIFCVILGYAGSFMFAICNVPAIVKIKKTESVEGVSLGWIGLSTAANICCGLFVLDSNIISGSWQYPLYGNYGFALFCCIWLLKLYRKYKANDKIDNNCYICSMNITKQHLVTDIAVATGITQKDTKQVVEAFLDLIELHLENGNTVELRGFGRFSVKGRKSRPVRNPKTGEVLQLGDRMVPTVKFCDDLKERVNK